MAASGARPARADGLDRLHRLLPAAWLGLLLCIGLIATPAPFATLDTPAAGRVVGHIFAHEAPVSLLLGVAMLWLARREAVRAADAGTGSQFSPGMVLALAAVFATVLGYYGLQPAMAAARAAREAGQPVAGLGFGPLHAISLGLFGVKTLCVAALAWRATAGRGEISPAASS